MAIAVVQAMYHTMGRQQIRVHLLKLHSVAVHPYDLTSQGGLPTSNLIPIRPMRQASVALCTWKYISLEVRAAMETILSGV